jgi:hypothetical protein
MLGSLFSRCKHLVNYSGKSLSFGQIKGIPVKIPLEIGGITIKPELIQTANACVQVLDTLQFGQCQRIRELTKLKPKPTQAIVDLSLEQDKCATMIASLAIISISSTNSPEMFEKVLANWIASVGTQIPSPDVTTTGEEKGSISNVTFYAKVEKKDKKGITNTKKMYRSIRRFRRIESPSLLDYSPKIVELTFDAHAKIRNAASVYPYLAKAIEEQKPFDIKENLRMMNSE